MRGGKKKAGKKRIKKGKKGAEI